MSDVTNTTPAQLSAVLGGQLAEQARRPEVGDKVALSDGYDSGYRVRAANPAHRVLLERVGDAGPLRVHLQPTKDGSYVLNKHVLTFLPSHARTCDLCEELFVPDDFADPEVCGTCSAAVAEADQLDALEPVAVPSGTLDQLYDLVSEALADVNPDLAEALNVSGAWSRPASEALADAVSLLRKLRGVGGAL